MYKYICHVKATNDTKLKAGFDLSPSSDARFLQIKVASSLRRQVAIIVLTYSTANKFLHIQNELHPRYQHFSKVTKIIKTAIINHYHFGLQ